MGGGRGFPARDRDAARNFAKAAVEKAFETERDMLSGDRWREGAFDLRGYRHTISFYGKRMTLERDCEASPAAVWRALEGLATPAAGYLALTPV